MSRERFYVIEVFNRPLNVLPLHKACPGSRFVLSLHNEMFRESKIPRGLALATLEVLERIVTVSQYIADSVTVRYPQAAPKVRTLYSGVRVEDYKLKGSPEAKAMAAATSAAKMGEMIQAGNVPAHIRPYGTTVQEIFKDLPDLRALYGRQANDFSPGAIGVYSYLNRIASGLRHFCALNRKFDWKLIDRSDVIPLTVDAYDILAMTEDAVF